VKKIFETILQAMMCRKYPAQLLCKSVISAILLNLLVATPALSAIQSVASPRRCQLQFEVKPQARALSALELLNSQKSKTLNMETLSTETLNTEAQNQASPILFTEKSIDEFYFKLGWLKRRKVNSLAQYFEKMQDGSRRTHLMPQLIDEVHATFVDPGFLKLDRYRWLNSDGKSYRLKSWVERQILEHGFRSLENQIWPDHLNKPKSQYTISRLARRALGHMEQRLSDNRFWQATMRLQADRALPPELMRSILLNGSVANQVEIETWYHSSGQNRLDLIHAMQPYMHFFAAMIFGLLIDDLNERWHIHKAKQNTEKLLKDLDALNDVLDEMLIEQQAASTNVRKNQQNAKLH
jgi:hypothetical protein